VERESELAAAKLGRIEAMTIETAKPILLLVEDDEDDAFFFSRLFEKTGAELTLHHVYNGSVAIEFLMRATTPAELPRVIFLDLKMPVMNGFDVLRWMRKQRFCAPVPVIVLSGSEQQSDIITSKQLGAADYIIKPVTVAELERIFRRISAMGSPVTTAKT
jgi:two-component system response regulator